MNRTGQGVEDKGWELVLISHRHINSSGDYVRGVLPLIDKPFFRHYHSDNNLILTNVLASAFQVITTQ